MKYDLEERTGLFDDLQSNKGRKSFMVNVANSHAECLKT